MSGIKGMRYTPRQTINRRNIWRSIRILRRFTLPQLSRTVPGAAYGTVRKFVSDMTRHGYIAKLVGNTGGNNGECQVYRLVKNIGPDYPTICSICKKPLYLDHVVPEETEKEKSVSHTKQAVTRIQEVSHDAK